MSISHLVYRAEITFSTFFSLTLNAVAHYRELLEVQIDEAVNSNAVCIPRPNAKVFL